MCKHIDEHISLYIDFSFNVPFLVNDVNDFFAVMKLNKVVNPVVDDPYDFVKRLFLGNQ